MMFRCDFEAYDTLVFREPKALTLGGVAQSVLPLPSTFYGALRSHYLRQKKIPFAAFNKSVDAVDPALKEKIGIARQIIGAADNDGAVRILGPLLSSEGRCYFPAPLAPFVAGNPAAGMPDETKRPIWDEPMRFPLRLPDDVPDRSGCWLSHTDLKFFLIQRLTERFPDGGASRRGEESTAMSASTRRRRSNVRYRRLDDFFAMELRHGHERADALTVKEGMLFSVSHFRPADAARAAFTVFLADADAADFAAGDVFLGGRRRIAQLLASEKPAPDFADVNALLGAALPHTRRFFLYLATPALFDEGWRPKEPDLSALPPGWRAELVSAAVGRPVFAGMYDAAAQKARPGRRAAPAGSVYFYELTATGKDSPELTAAGCRAFVEHYQFNRSISDHRPKAGFGIACVGSW